MTHDLIVVSNANDAGSWLPGVPVVGDVRSERGSLVGIHTALTRAADDVLVVAWDMPFVTGELLQLVRDRGRHAMFAAVPESLTGLEPMCALYTSNALSIVTAAVDAGNLRLMHMVAALPSLERIGLSDVSAVGAPERLFFNVNTPTDLAAAERMAAQA